MVKEFIYGLSLLLRLFSWLFLIVSLIRFVVLYFILSLYLCIHTLQEVIDTLSIYLCVSVCGRESK